MDLDADNKKRNQDNSNENPKQAKVASQAESNGNEADPPKPVKRELVKQEIHRDVCSRLTKKAEPPPTRDVNRDSGTESANGGWLRRLVRRLAFHIALG
jgi:hypothetical protein